MLTTDQSFQHESTSNQRYNSHFKASKQTNKLRKQTNKLRKLYRISTSISTSTSYTGELYRGRYSLVILCFNYTAQTALYQYKTTLKV